MFILTKYFNNTFFSNSTRLSNILIKVSWIRHRDLHVLTVGAFPFTNDDRFTAYRDPSSGDWVLVIQRPETDDTGLYECSISTKPVITHTVRLKIVGKFFSTNSKQ